jgi:hypothetical protein
MTLYCLFLIGAQAGDLALKADASLIHDLHFNSHNQTQNFIKLFFAENLLDVSPF